MENQRTKLVVVNEDTLGYIMPHAPNMLNVYRAKVTGGKSSRFFSYGCEHFMLNSSDVVRLANEKDFDFYRCSFEGFKQDKVNYEFAD